jgi:hypothetical protein
MRFFVTELIVYSFFNAEQFVASLQKLYLSILSTKTNGIDLLTLIIRVFTLIIRPTRGSWFSG